MRGVFLSAIDMSALQFTMRERLPEMTHAYQINQDASFYLKFSFPERLYVKWNGKEYDSHLPEGQILFKAVYGNALYFIADRMIYNAVFTPQNGIVISFLRSMIPDELITLSGTCSVVRFGKTYVYRICDDPVTHGQYVDAANEELTGLHLTCIHRGKPVFVTEHHTLSVRKLGGSAIVINASNKFIPLYANDSSPFLYLYQNGYLHTLETETVTFHPALRIDLFLTSIVGVVGRMITVECMQNNVSGFVLASALLPPIINIAPEVPKRANEWRMQPANDEKDRIIEDLINNAEELQADIAEKVKIIERKSKSREGPECAICMDRTPNIIFFDCKHVVVCEECFSSVAGNPSTAFKTCPNCRGEIKSSNFFHYSSTADVFTLGLILTELCVVMTTEERYEVFDNYRSGMQSDLIADAETAKFVEMLTQLYRMDRPSCREMLDHSYLKDIDAYSTQA